MTGRPVAPSTALVSSPQSPRLQNRLIIPDSIQEDPLQLSVHRVLCVQLVRTRKEQKLQMTYERDTVGVDFVHRRNQIHACCDLVLELSELVALYEMPTVSDHLWSLDRVAREIGFKFDSNGFHIDPDRLITWSRGKDRHLVKLSSSDNDDDLAATPSHYTMQHFDRMMTATHNFDRFLWVEGKKHHNVGVCVLAGLIHGFRITFGLSSGPVWNDQEHFIDFSPAWVENVGEKPEL